MITTTNMGLRNGGGLGDYLEKQDSSEDTYITRLFYDVFFFVVVTIFLLNVVFGLLSYTITACIHFFFFFN